MRFSKSSIAQVFYRSLNVFIASCALIIPLFAIQTAETSEGIQTKIKEPRGRTISLKLPLKLQPDYHWTFMSREDFLSGELVLRIIRDKQDRSRGGVGRIPHVGLALWPEPSPFQTPHF